MDKPRLVYVLREDATPEGELAALADVYRFVLERHEKKKAARADGGEEEGAEHGHAPEPHRRHTVGGEAGA